MSAHTVDHFLVRWHQGLTQTTRSLRHRPFRLYSCGQVISMTGTAMQNMALAWLAYDMTRSATILGLVGICTNAPILLLSLFGGAVADGHNRRRLIVATQWVEMIQASLLTILVVLGVLEIWMIMALSLVLGLSMAFELPARHAFVTDLVEKEDVVNAVSINSIIYNSTRMLGPTVGAVLLAQCGPSICFGLNAISFIAALVSLHLLRGVQANVREHTHATIRQGLRVVASDRNMRNALLLTLVTSFFGLQFTVLLPVFVREVFDGQPHALGFMMAASSLGALVSGFLLAGLNKGELLYRNIRIASLFLPLTLFTFALSDKLWLSLMIELLMGVCVTVQLTSTSSALLAAPKEVRGRVMGLYTAVLVGVMPFGSLLVGRISDLLGVQQAVAICAGACCAASLLYLLSHLRHTSGADNRLPALPVSTVRSAHRCNLA